MEAPNVYFDQHTAQYVHERRNEDDIEYVHKDAFVEKACSILKDISCQIEIIEQFKNRIR